MLRIGSVAVLKESIDCLMLMIGDDRLQIIRAQEMVLSHMQIELREGKFGTTIYCRIEAGRKILNSS